MVTLFITKLQAASIDSLYLLCYIYYIGINITNNTLNRNAIMDTQQGSQLSLFGNFSYQAHDEVRYAIEVAHAAGVAAAFGATPDKRSGTVKITLVVELDDVTIRLVQNLVGEGWTRTDTGAEWAVILPPDLFEQDAYTPALAYARAFKDTLRDNMPHYQFLFNLKSAYTL